MSLWSGNTYWPVWMIATGGTFLLREIWALASGDGYDTLSEWVWRALAITKDEPVASWSATDFLVCGAWLVLVTWLSFHFFFRRFA